MLLKTSHRVVKDAVTSSLIKLKVNDLKTIAVQCGITTSGKKADLFKRLDNHFNTIITNATSSTTHQFIPNETIPKSILSFDVGYRNLAHVKLDHHHNILDWRRTDLQLEDFHASTVAPIMRNYVQELVVPMIKDETRVEAIVIEKQRYRENGGHNVFEHTIRVNTIEAMLWYALYEVVNTITPPSSSMAMEAIARPAVDRMWRTYWEEVTPPPPEDTSKAKMNRYKKQACVQLIKHWLEKDAMVRIDQEEIMDGFLREKKQDDMADSLLQAMSWYQWRHSSLKYIQQCIDG